MANTTDEDNLLQDYTDAKRKEYVPVFIFYSLIIVFGLIGNSFAFRFYRFKARRTVSSFFLAMLAANDLLTSILLIDKIYQHYQVGQFTSSIGCRLLMFVNHIFVLNSGLIILTMNIDRFQHVLFPFSRWRFTRKSAKICLAALLSLSITVGTSNLFLTDSVQYDIDVSQNITITGHRCTHSRQDNHQTPIYIFHFIDLLTVIVTIVSAIVIYSLIAWKISRSKKALQSIDSTKIPKEVISSNHKYHQSHGYDKDTGVSQYAAKYFDESIGCVKEEINTSYQVDKETKQHTYTNDKSTNCVKEEINKSYQVDEETQQHSYTNDVSYNSHGVEDNNNCSIPNTNDHGKADIVDRGGRKKLTSTIGAKNAKHTRTQHTSEARITAMMFTMTLGTVLCVVPYFYISLVDRPDMSKDEFEMTAKARILRGSFAVYSALNPYVIGIFYTEFRVFAIDFLKRTFCCCCFGRR